MKAELIFTGTEILMGQILNTHGQYLGRKLSDLGIEVILHTTVGDDWERMKEIFVRALGRSDIIITTGGLGPTSDDLTKETIAEVLGLPMMLHEESMLAIKEFFKSRKNKVPNSSLKQAYFPEGAKVIPNPCGVAPGAIIEVKDRIVIILPGPPWELEAMYESYVGPYLISLPGRGEVTRFSTIKITGIREDNVQEMLADLDGVSNPEISYIARPGEVHVRISAHAKTTEEADEMVKPLREEVAKRLKHYIFAVDDEIIEVVVSDLLKEHDMTLAVAEACTAGLLQARLCEIAGCSSFLKGGIICSHNKVKADLLGMDPKDIEANGTISAWTTIEMAKRIREIMGADLGLAVNGVVDHISFQNKPIGTTYVALATPDNVYCREYKLPGRRMAIRQGVVNSALKMVRHYFEHK